jgi:hypothetical protein
MMLALAPFNETAASSDNLLLAVAIRQLQFFVNSSFTADHSREIEVNSAAKCFFRSSQFSCLQNAPYRKVQRNSGQAKMAARATP